MQKPPQRQENNGPTGTTRRPENIHTKPPSHNDAKCAGKSYLENRAPTCAKMQRLLRRGIKVNLAPRRNENDLTCTDSVRCIRQSDQNQTTPQESNLARTKYPNSRARECFNFATSVVGVVKSVWQGLEHSLSESPKHRACQDKWPLAATIIAKILHLPRN